MIFPEEDKAMIVKALVPVLGMTSACNDLLDAKYDKEKEIVELYYINGIKRVNVNMDSGAAMILDIMKVVLH